MRVLVEELSPAAIDRIEQRMRPGQYSVAGFLGNDEHLVDVIARDRQVLSDLSLTPEQIGDRLESIVGQAFRHWEVARRAAEQSAGTLSKKSAANLLSTGIEVRPHYRVTGGGWLGSQGCPFENANGILCKDSSCYDFIVRNTEAANEFGFPGLSIHLIRDHHFFEGAVPYRVDPAQAAAVLGLLPG